jgi:hypothetical protein
MQWLIFLLAFEIGTTPYNGWVMQDGVHVQETPQHYTTFEVEAEAFEHLFIGGEIRTRMYGVKDSWTFSPFADEYTFRAGVRFGPVEMGFRHLCTHPVVPYIASSGVDIAYEGAYEELYVRVELRR